jgi:hypothetical protein
MFIDLLLVLVALLPLMPLNRLRRRLIAPTSRPHAAR